MGLVGNKSGGECGGKREGYGLLLHEIGFIRHGCSSTILSMSESSA